MRSITACAQVFDVRAAALAALFAGATACASAPFAEGGAADSFLIRIAYKTETIDSDGSTSSSSGHNVLVKRILSRDADGIVAQFDVPATTTPDDRKRAWQFPARILIAQDRPPELLNWPEAETRLHSLLGDAAPSLCGRWIFTWTAMKIDCEPTAVTTTLQPFIIDTEKFRAGAPYTDHMAMGQAQFSAADGPEGMLVLVAELPLDGEAVKRQRAEADIAIAEMTDGSVLTIEDAMRGRAGEQIEGTISVRIELDRSSGALLRTRTSTTTITKASGVVERGTATETTQMHPF